MDCQPHDVQHWINVKTNKEKFTALHLATKTGNLKIIEILVQSGADIHAKTLAGSNVLHIAAQAN